MDIIESLVKFFGLPPEETKGKIPEGMSPTAWGYQEYDGIIREMAKDKQIDINNHLERNMFIQEFVKDHDRIEVKEGEIHFGFKKPDKVTDKK